MPLEVDSIHLRKYIVRIDTEDGIIRGTGFFVAPGWVLTCAHVVKELDTVLLRLPGSEEPFFAVVKGRSAAPPAGWNSGIWPFPDLALLEYSAELGPYPCVLLSLDAPRYADDCHTWGYSRRESDVDPVGSAGTLDYQGTDGDEYLSLKNGEVHPGLSGSPLLCPTQRAVVGVIADTRDPQGGRGGWAAPVSALGFGLETMSPELVSAATEVLRLNRATVLKDRMSWHRVLPVPEAKGQLEEAWATFARGVRSQPSQMLLAGHRVVPYLFHEPALAWAQEWCEGPEPIALALVRGSSGSGKSRFAIECCHRMKDLGWLAGFMTKSSTVSAPVPRFVVIDDAEEVSNLSELLKKLKETATDLAPVRVLVLTQSTTAESFDLLEPLRREVTLQWIVDACEELDVADAVLDPNQRIALYEESIVSFANAWSTAVPDRFVDLSSIRFEVPLEVLMEALNSVLSVDGDDSL